MRQDARRRNPVGAACQGFLSAEIVFPSCWSFRAFTLAPALLGHTKGDLSIQDLRGKVGSGLRIDLDRGLALSLKKEMTVLLSNRVF